MAIVSISRIQHRRGLQQDLPLLASAELGWSLDTQRLYIGNGSTAEGAPRTGVSEILTEHSDILQLAETYNFKNEDAGYTPRTGGRNSRYNAIAYGTNKYVAVGYTGGIATSVDTITWTPIYGGTTNTLDDVCFGDGRFVAVGASGTIIYSTDGAVWNKASTNIFLTLTGVCYAGGALASYFVTSNTGTILTSVDAETWTTINPGVAESFNSIAYYNNKLVAVGNNGTVITSTNGATWTQQSVPTGYNLSSVNYNNDRWVVTGSNSTVLYSLNGTNWFYSYTDTFRASANNGNFWVFVGDGGNIWNINGVVSAIELVATTSPVALNLYDVIYSVTDNQYVAVGQTGTILTSNDGESLNQQTSGVTEDLNRIIYDSTNSLYLVVGNNGTILTSADAASWTEETTGTTNNLYGIGYWDTTTTYIVVGEGGKIITSADGSNWTNRNSGVSADLQSVTVAINRAVVVGNAGTILTSNVISGAIGTVWVDRTSITTEDLHHVNYISYTLNAINFNYFFSVGNNATLIYSADGITWATLFVPSTNHLFNIQFGSDNYFRILGSVGFSTIYGFDITDYEELTYQSLAILQNNTTGINGPTLYGSAYGVATYVVVGQFDTVLASIDGINYVSQTQQTFTVDNLITADILDILFENSMFTAVGNKGLILTSTDSSVWSGISYTFGDNQTIRTIQKKLDDVVSVKDFGAKGDGITDDTESINRALYELYCRTSAPAARKILHFPAGVYIISDGINVPTYATLKGEGPYNTILRQTADSSYVSYVVTTADSKQQVGAQIGYNGAELPKNITISDMGWETSADGIWLVNASSVTLERINIIGGVDLPTGEGDFWTGIYIIGSTLVPPTDINIIDCHIEKFNLGVYQPGTEFSRNIWVNSTSFINMHKAFYLCNDGGMVNTMTVSNCIFDLVNDIAIDANYATNIVSTFNSYRDVANGYLGAGNSTNNIINFGTNSIGCASINDQFERTQQESYDNYAWVVGNEQTIMLAAGHELRIGLWEQGGGESRILTGAQSNEPTGFAVRFNDDSFNKKIQYMLQRDDDVRSGTLLVTYNAIAQTYNIDDDSSETADIGIVFSLSDDGTDISLDYTSTAGNDITFVMAESYLDLSW